MKTLTAPKHYHYLLEQYPNFHKSGSIKGMKKLYYGKDALLVKCGDYIYNISSNPGLYGKIREEIK